MKTNTPVTETLLGMWQISSSGIFSNSWEDWIVAFWGLSQNVVVITNIMKEPWDTPQRATPKSCYPCPKKIRKKEQKFKKISKNNWKKQSTHSKTNSKKKTQKKKQEKTEEIPHKKQTKIEIFKNKNKKWTKKSKNTIKKNRKCNTQSK